ncbi:MAG TPA: hypothetical protein VFU06_04835 [Longimicrobiales bacterium]|nr:hypothetical protein [Longimicrobiales bacterium]
MQGGEFGQWATFVSPAFFSVMPTKPLWQRAKGLARATRDPDQYARAVDARRALLARSPLSIVLETPATRDAVEARSAAPAAAGLAPEERAAQLVELYFHQLLHGDTTLLDLRQQAFRGTTPLVWKPASWVAKWDPSFIAALRQVYIGFYRADPAGFRSGLRALNLERAEDVFRRHFGDGQRAVRFEVKHFVSTFHQVFVICRDAKTSLHADFLPLGLYLSSLYDHLEHLGSAVDVAAAFERASVLEAEPASASLNAGL